MPQLHSYAGPAARAVLDELDEVYRAVFSAPPWNESDEELAGFRVRFEADLERPGFRIATASLDGLLDGFGTGWRTPDVFRRDRAYGTVSDELGAEQVSQYLVGAFEVDELAVHPRSQGAGLGRKILAELCAGEPAWMLTSRHAVDTVAFYHRVGWRELAPLDPAASKLAVFVTPAS